jgi:hypothetical protein
MDLGECLSFLCGGMLACWTLTLFPLLQTPHLRKFTEFLPKFYASLLSLLNLERMPIPSIFPDPPLTLSTLITSILSALQPSFSERLASLFNHYGTSALKEVVLAYKTTEEFAVRTTR